MKNRLGRLLLAGAVLFSAAACSVGLAGDRGQVSYTLSELVGRMPVKDTLEARWVWPAFLAQGDAALLNLFTQPPSTWKASDEQVMDAIGGLAAYTGSGRAPSADRLAFVEGIETALDAPLSREKKAFLISQLQVAGGEECLGTLSRFLTDPYLCGPAAQAMTVIGANAEAFLLKALPASVWPCRSSIVHAIGQVGSRRSVEPLLAEAAVDDAARRTLAMDALANLGDIRAEAVLMKEVAGSAPGTRNNAASRMLAFVRRLAANGEHDAALRLSRTLAGAFTSPAERHLRAAALRSMASLEGEKSLEALVSAFADTTAATQRAVLDIASTLKGSAVTARWARETATAPVDSRRRILDMLGDRKDPSAFEAVRARLGDPDPGVRRSAILAAAKLSPAAAVDATLDLLARSAERTDADAARHALGTLSPDVTVKPVTRALSGLKVPGAVAMLDLLAVQKTGVQVEHILALTRNESPQVRVAALRALGAVGRSSEIPAVVDLCARSSSDAESAASLRCLASLAEKNPDRQQRAAPILAVLEKAPLPQQTVLLKVLGRIGGRQALVAVCSRLRSRNADVKDAALRALAEWGSIEAFDSLLVLAQSKEPVASRVLAIRALVRVVENAGLPPAAAVRYHERTLASAFRIEEKRLVIGALAGLETPDALRPLAPYISDDSLGLDAGIASWNIAKGKGDRMAEVGARRLIEPRLPAHFRVQAARVFDARNDLNEPPEGFTALFNGRDLSGWKGLVENPIVRAKMTKVQLDSAQAHADSSMRAHWSVRDGMILFDGKGESLCSAKDFTNFEMFVDWKIGKEGDSGIYLRGSPQVQIWDPAQWPEGSGGLYNNAKGPSHPLLRADNPVGEWNTFRIRMIGEYVTVWLNDVLVVDSVALENYWDRSLPIFPTGQVELQSHNSPLYFRNIYIRELPSIRPLFNGPLFNGKDLSGWQVVEGKNGSWGVQDGILYTTGEGGGWLSTEKEYSNFRLDLDFKVVEGGNSGVFLRSPHGGDPAYVGMEIQVLDDYAAEYATLRPWQYAGSVYGLFAPSKRATRHANEWQHMCIIADGTKVTVVMNGETTINADLLDCMDRENDHPGIKRRSGFIGLQNHSSRVEYKNIMIQELE